MTSGTTQPQTFCRPQALNAKNPAFRVEWEENDPENPRNWSSWYKGYMIGTISLSTTVMVLYATSYTSGLPGIEATFNGISHTDGLVGLTTYMLGMALGTLVLTPFSEFYGRYSTHLISTALFTVLIIPVATASSLSAVVTSRFFGGFAGSATVATAPGSVNDLVSGKNRALAFSCWSLAAMNAAVIGPIMGGFVFQFLGWRWVTWIVVICESVLCVALFFSRETYAPVLLQNKRKRIQRETGEMRWWCQYDPDEEMDCLFWDVYIGVLYAILFLCFVGYPIVFHELRGWSPGLAGLGYCGIGTGIALAVLAEPLIRTLIDRHPPDPATGRPSPEANISVICIGAVLIPIGQLWFSWTALPPVHWASPILAGLLFGFGNALVFIYVVNYIAGSYGIYAASAMAGMSVIRYFFAGVLPLAGEKIYRALGVKWAATTLALVEIFLIPIPFIFYRYGGRIRRRSMLISRLN
ncbi:major facilitator superfamily domain-containing protein [Aspergillus ambiguus]|uniref:major facilitator superfamily domain-containing protein n=1 Tax=Aspergillus ambiguus TaxID=176160 RepID=UPI003CCCD476